MYLAQSKAILIIGVSVLLITTMSLLWVHPSYPAHLSNIHLSTSRREIVTFRQRPEFMDLSEASDGNWTAILPPNGGFTSHRSLDGDNYEMVGITMFHQLHCLQMIRAAMQDLVSGRPVGSRMKAEMDAKASRKTMKKDHQEDQFGVRKRHGPQLDQEHYLHCFDYLMQGILCSADDTIEYGHEDDEGRRAVDGYEVAHQCRSADAIWAEVMGKKSVPGWKSATDLKQ